MSEKNTLSFNNTEIAFRGKSDKELSLAHILFRLINNSILVNLGSILVKAALKLHIPIKQLIKTTLFKQFIGGESLNDCDKTIDKLYEFKIGSILDYSVEGKKTEKEFIRVMEEIIKTILKAKDNPKIPFSVFKVTGIAPQNLLEKVSRKGSLTDDEKTAFQNVKARVDQICKAAYDNHVRILIDAEESWMQNAIDNMAVEMMEKYNKEKAIVYHTLQMYRQDRVAFLIEAHARAVLKEYRLGIKLVRGAYMEKEAKRADKMGYNSPIHLSKKDTDTDFNVALRFCLKHVNRIALCAGTHNEESTLLLIQLMDEIKLDRNHEHVFFAQLLGMSDHITYNLTNAGYNAVKYVPYGPVKEVMPYLIRRAHENNAIVGQMSRELSLITAEIERRKKK